MASQEAALKQYLASRLDKTKWEDALKDIFVFIAHYVPRDLFDLKIAAPQQLELLKAVQEGKRYFIIRAPRKGGKTICVAIIAVWLTLRNQKYRVFILSGSLYQAEWLYEYCKKILWPGGAEGEARRKHFAQFLVTEPMKTRIVYKAGGWIRYSAASSKQVNAPTADALLMDEFVLIPINIREEAWPMIRSSDDMLRILLSTATPGKEGTDAFLDILAEADEIGFTKIEWLAKDCPFLQTTAARHDALIAGHFISPEMFRTQYIGLLPRGAGRVFPKTFIRKAFKAPDPNNPGYLMNGTPYNPEALEFKGDSKGAFDWGYDHDTAMIAGYRGLDKKIVLMSLLIEHNTSATDWANRAEKTWKEHGVFEWYCDASGAFENREIEDRGLRVIRRPFQSKTEGKEWMIGVAYYWLEHEFVVIPDTPEFDLLKRQILAYRRGPDGKPVKKFDHGVDGFLLLLSGWDPIYYEESRRRSAPQKQSVPLRSSANDWEKYRSGSEPWMPDSWKERRGELTRQPWER